MCVQQANARSVITVDRLKNRLMKNAGIACTGALSGLTRKRIVRSDAVERSAASEMEKRGVVTALM